MISKLLLKDSDIEVYLYNIGNYNFILVVISKHMYVSTSQRS